MNTKTTLQERPDDVASHYGRHGIVDRILAALSQAGHDTDRLSPEMLYPYDQLHDRQLAATREHVAWLDLDATKHALDVGCGVGGAARYMVAAYGCRVTGIDLTEEFVEAARELTKGCGLASLVEFRQGDALAMPYPDASFDAATCLSVSVNIADKAGLLAEIGRVLKPGGRVAWSEIVVGPAGPPYFPLPCAREPGAAFLATQPALRAVFQASNLNIVEWADETEAHHEYVRHVKASGLPANRSNAMVLGGDFVIRVRNFNRSIDEGRLIPMLIVAEKG